MTGIGVVCGPVYSYPAGSQVSIDIGVVCDPCPAECCTSLIVQSPTYLNHWPYHNYNTSVFYPGNGLSNGIYIVG